MGGYFPGPLGIATFAGIKVGGRAAWPALEKIVPTIASSIRHRSFAPDQILLHSSHNAWFLSTQTNASNVELHFYTTAVRIVIKPCRPFS
jgi:hypothetical protein